MTFQEQGYIFNQWLDQHRALIFKIVRAYGRTAMDQDDLFQEITIQVWRSIPAFRRESAVTTWIYRIALNTAIRWINKEQQYRNANGAMAAIPEILSPPVFPVEEQLNWLYETIHQLDEIDRSLALLLLDGFSYKEMAAILGISVSHVGVKINRIKKQLIIQSKKFIEHGI
ncbi:RNA polymerase sigma factor [Niastella caeni]|uniref:RNA polymerase sigma factor n=1 Tax=Niastella caeni TaxID=2569763 RepID=A0A4S8HX46_9BACT|nr:RNA polymerase sigma factor [Niastella caeni]THU40283.1 RNA polymerase sigma factor [Niastella caeni]